jgi:hypothetical protein
MTVAFARKPFYQVFYIQVSIAVALGTVILMSFDIAGIRP